MFTERFEWDLPIGVRPIGEVIGQLNELLDFLRVAEARGFRHCGVNWDGTERVVTFRGSREVRP